MRAAVPSVKPYHSAGHARHNIMSITDFKYVAFGNSFESTKDIQCYDEVECLTDAMQLCDRLGGKHL